MKPIGLLLSLFASIPLAKAAVIEFSYLGIGESVDLLGNPTFISAGFPEFGSFSFTAASSIVDKSHLDAFSFLTFSHATDFIGNPIGYLVVFGMDDLLSFSASFDEGRFVSFSFIAETELEIDFDPSSSTNPPKAINLRFVASANGFGSLAEIEPDQTTLKHEGPIAVVPEPSTLLLASLPLSILLTLRNRGCGPTENQIGSQPPETPIAPIATSPRRSTATKLLCAKGF